MPAVCIVVKTGRAPVLKVNKRKQPVLDAEFVQYEAVLKRKVDCHEDLDAHHLSPKNRGLARLKGC